MSESLRVILCKGKSASDTVFGNNVDHDFTCSPSQRPCGDNTIFYLCNLNQRQMWEFSPVG